MSNIKKFLDQIGVTHLWNKVEENFPNNEELAIIVNAIDETKADKTDLVGKKVSNGEVFNDYTNNTATGDYSHAEGHGTIASGENQHVQGKYNIEDTENRFAHIVGNGEYQAPSNIHTLDWQGNAWFAGTLKIGGATQDDEAAAEVLTSLDLPNENDALELLYEMDIIEPIIDENGLILTDENGNILTGK